MVAESRRVIMMVLVKRRLWRLRWILIISKERTKCLNVGITAFVFHKTPLTRRVLG